MERNLNFEKKIMLFLICLWLLTFAVISCTPEEEEEPIDTNFISTTSSSSSLDKNQSLLITSEDDSVSISIE